MGRCCGKNRKIEIKTTKTDMKKNFFVLAGLLVAAMAQAQDPVLMTINGEPIPVSEFTYIYEKNNKEALTDPKSIDEYLDLFVNFKLKVAEAKAQGIDTTAEFKKELAGYRAQATPKYMQSEHAIDSLVRLSYDHLSRDRRTAHIAIQCPMNADSAQTAEAYAKISDARLRVTEGRLVGSRRKAKRVVEDFYTVAREVSNDPAVAETGGEIGWITPFRYVYPLEQAVYATEVGAVSEIFRTPYGFHIVLVEEELPHEEVHASHIMKMVPRGNDSIRAVAKSTIDSIAGVVTVENFADEARKLSDDKGSAVRGGDLGWFGKGLMVAPFEKQAFSMEKGTISEPFESNFGWHIIYLQGRRGMQPLDTVYDQLLQQVKRDERFKEADRAFLNETRAEYNLPEGMSDAEVRQYADEHLEEKYADLRHLVQEYHDGILLFDVSLTEVWDKAGKDTAGLTEFFAKNKKNYTWEKPHFKGYLVYCKNKNTAKAARSIIKNANPDSIDSYLNHRLNIDSVTYVKFSHGLWEQGQNAAVDKYGFKQKKTECAVDEEFPIVFCVGKVLKAPEAYEDERGKVVTDYQDYLEKEWVRSLREKYEVKIDQEVLKAIKN